MRRALILGAAASLSLGLTACPKDNGDPVTGNEAQLSMEETGLASQAEALAASSVELSTNFTIGGAVQSAVDQLKVFIGSQLPCADIVLAGNVLTITYGAKPGNCTYRGLPYSGKHIVTVVRNEAGDVEVDHEWKDFSNTLIKVSGTAVVDYSVSAASRHVKHDLTWTRLSDLRTGHGTGDEVQKALQGGIAEGFTIDGSRGWDGQSGHWDLAVSGVQWRWSDPVPQAGTYTLSLPNKKTLSLAFSRVDDTRIKVTFTSGERTYSFIISKTGTIAGG